VINLKLIDFQTSCELKGPESFTLLVSPAFPCQMFVRFY